MVCNKNMWNSIFCPLTFQPQVMRLEAETVTTGADIMDLTGTSSILGSATTLRLMSPSVTTPTELSASSLTSNTSVFSLFITLAASITEISAAHSIVASRGKVLIGWLRKKQGESASRWTVCSSGLPPHDLRNVRRWCRRNIWLFRRFSLALAHMAAVKMLPSKSLELNKLFRLYRWQTWRLFFSSRLHEHRVHGNSVEHKGFLVRETEYLSICLYETSPASCRKPENTNVQVVGEVLNFPRLHQGFFGKFSCCYVRNNCDSPLLFRLWIFQM